MVSIKFSLKIVVCVHHARFILPRAHCFNDFLLLFLFSHTSFRPNLLYTERASVTERVQHTLVTKYKRHSWNL